MPDPTAQASYAVALVSSLADAGIDVAFVSPGSRNTPLTLALSGEPRIRDLSIRDERSAGFAALGYAKASGMPAIVACTSGSAPAHYLPSIVEADQSTTPMIVLTADRPVRLRGTGAPQTTDQTDLYGTHVKGFLEVDTSDPRQGVVDGASMAATAMDLPQGPVHANLPFDEPLVPDELVPPAAPGDPPAVTGGGQRPNPTQDVGSFLNGRNVLIVVGGRGGFALSRAVNDLASRLGAPVIADPQSNVTGPNVLAYGDLVVTARHGANMASALDLHAPDVILRLGPIPTSKSLWTWMESSDVPQVLVESSRLGDPLMSADITINDDPVRVLADVTVQGARNNAFLERWLALDNAAAAAVAASLSGLPFPNEPSIAATIAAHVPDHSMLFVGSSRPIRDIDSYGTSRPTVTVLANRGVNGIDGAISTALGVAVTGTPTTLYLGDVSALHDIAAITEVQRLGVPLRIVVVNNDGGGIFSFLPQARSSAVPVGVFERHWGTPHGLSVAPIAAAMGLDATTVATSGELIEAVHADIAAPGLIEIATDRDMNRSYHQIIVKAVAAALAGSEHIE